VLLGVDYAAKDGKKDGLLKRLNDRLGQDETLLQGKAYRETDGLTGFRQPEHIGADDTPGQLDYEQESLLLADLAEADLWAQIAEACADTPLLAEAVETRDRYLTTAAVRAADLRRWRAIRAVRAACDAAAAPLRGLAQTLHAMGNALQGKPTDNAPALPYPPDDERRWQDRFSTWQPGRGTQWHQLDQHLCQRLDGLTETLTTVATALAPIRELLLTAMPPPPADADDRQPPQDPDKQLRERAARTAEMALRAAELTRQMRAEFPCRAYLHTIQHDQSAPDDLGWRLTRQPYDLAPYLFAPLDPESGLPPADLPGEPIVPLLDTFRSVVFTSATLYVEHNLAYFQRLLDLPGGFVAEARIKSPFQYDSAVIGAVPHFLTPYNSGWERLDKYLWQEAALKTLLPLILALDGRTLILFTSNDEMRMAADWLAPHLAAHDIELLVQNGASQWEIRRFRRIEQSVLLGVDRMWTGVDFAGLTLAHVVVWRAPFPAVGDPLIAHRKQYESSTVYWDGFYYPSTRLKLRQGFGRLIRRETDRGAFTLLDSRLSAAHKHHHLLAELEVSLTEYGSHEALYDGYVPAILHLLRLGEDFKRRGWSVARLLTTPNEGSTAHQKS
jgi:ATP-dependent DNA helicase DinG